MIFLITGASGFLGKIITQNLLKSGNKVIGLGRTANELNVDLSNISEGFQMPYADIVVHAAGKAHIYPKTESEIKEFWDVNLKGTENLLKSLEINEPPKKFIFISSVSVYGLNEGINVNEKHPLNATDPYGMSKIQAEILVETWCKGIGIDFLILRLPLIAGPNPPGNLGTMINGLKKGFYFNIGGGNARKSIVLAEDVANLISKESTSSGIFNLTDGYHPSFKEISKKIAVDLEIKSVPNIPLVLARFLGFLGDLLEKSIFRGKTMPFNTVKLNKINSTLTFDDTKAVKELGWKPRAVLEYFKIN